MKNFYFFICFGIISLNVYSQDPDPDFFQTWYLYEMNFELDPPIIVEGWNPTGDPNYPQISPDITFLEPLQFSGFGICNTFDGSLLDLMGSGGGSGCATEVSTLTAGTDDCGFFENEFELAYFGFFEPNFASVCYQISDDGDGFQTLILTGSIFSSFRFRNTPILAIPTFDRDKVVIHPNPAYEFVSISSEQITISEIKIYSLNGQLALVTKEAERIDISELTSGFYFIEVRSSEGNSLIKKLIIK